MAYPLVLTIKPIAFEAQPGETWEEYQQRRRLIADRRRVVDQMRVALRSYEHRPLLGAFAGVDLALGRDRTRRDLFVLPGKRGGRVAWIGRKADD